MGSVGAMNKGSANRYFQKIQKNKSKYVPEGVEGLVKFKGKVENVIYKLIGGLKSSMGYLGAKKIVNLRENFYKEAKRIAVELNKENEHYIQYWNQISSISIQYIKTTLK